MSNPPHSASDFTPQRRACAACGESTYYTLCATCRERFSARSQYALSRPASRAKAAHDSARIIACNFCNELLVEGETHCRKCGNAPEAKPFTEILTATGKTIGRGQALGASRPLIYVAHPLGAGDGREYNIRAAGCWVCWIAEMGGAPLATWLTLATHWSENMRATGLEVSFAQIERCDAIWLCGSYISHGMALELKHAEAHGKPVAHFIGYPSPPIGVVHSERFALRAIAELQRARK
jgi:hypothetical protein